MQTSRHTHTSLQCSPTSVGLTQARPNHIVLTLNKTCLHYTACVLHIGNRYSRKSLIRTSVIQIFTYPNPQIMIFIDILLYINPLTINDAIWHRLTLAAGYQLAQSVLN